MDPNDLLRIHGNYLPGEWFVLDIIDRIANLPQASSSEDMRQVIDGFAEVMKNLFIKPGFSTINISYFSIS